MPAYGASVYGTSTYDVSITPVGAAIYGQSVYGGTTVYEPPAGPPPPPPPVVIFDPEILWRFILADSFDLNNITELFSSSSNLDLALNKPGSCTLSIPIDSEYADLINPVTSCIKAYRKNDLIWSGPVWNIEESLPENSMQITSIGWFEILNHRYLRYEKIYDGTSWTAGTIALNLLTIANNQRDGALSALNPDGSGTVRSTWLGVGTSTDAQVRTRTYQKWQNIGAAITEWAEIENGYDFAVDPVTRDLNFYSNFLGSELRRDRPQAQFGYNWGPNNLSSFKRQLDASTLATQTQVQGQFALATASADSSSTSPLSIYGLWEEQHNLNDVIDTNVVAAFANAELAVRAVPRTIYSLTPFPYLGSKRVPEPFVDYRIGDHVYFTAKFAKRISIKGQAVRVYGMRISVDADGNETVGDLQLSPSG